MVTPERAAEILKIKPRAIYRQVERGELHFVETGAGELLICCSSLRGETGESSKALVRARASY
jgi:predicted site-specific integrase-resolvase